MCWFGGGNILLSLQSAAVVDYLISHSGRHTCLESVSLMISKKKIGVFNQTTLYLFGVSKII